MAQAMPTPFSVTLRKSLLRSMIDLPAIDWRIPTGPE